jgi:crotonobetainyl-CoA:carnitine CoA-transferase CaiB-like acyl-CoA transferase
VVAGPICDVEQLFEDKHVQERDTLVSLDDPVLGKVRIQNVIPRYRRNPGKMRWPGKPDIGADTEEILGSLGYSPKEIEQMTSTGVVTSKRSGAVSVKDTKHTATT